MKTREEIIREIPKDIEALHVMQTRWRLYQDYLLAQCQPDGVPAREDEIHNGVKTLQGSWEYSSRVIDSLLHTMALVDELEP